MVAHVLAASIFGSENLNIYVVKASTVIFLLKFFKRQLVVIVDNKTCHKALWCYYQWCPLATSMCKISYNMSPTILNDIFAPGATLIT